MTTTIRNWLNVRNSHSQEVVIALDCVDAYEESGVYTNVYTRGGHTFEVPMSVNEFRQMVVSTNA